MQLCSIIIVACYEKTSSIEEDTLPFVSATQSVVHNTSEIIAQHLTDKTSACHKGPTVVHDITRQVDLWAMG